MRGVKIPGTESTSSGEAKPGQLGARLVSSFLLGFLFLFAATAPWRIFGRDVDRWSVAVGAAILAGAIAAAVVPSWRRALARAARQETRWPPWAAAAGGFAALAFFARVVASRSAALAINAWDLTLMFHRPIEETLSGRPLWCAFYGHSYLGTHASFLMFAFVPFYAVARTDLWLLAAQAIALAAGGVAAFILFRRLLEDDPAAGLLAVAFWSNAYTARAAQYVFHIEVFYPVAVFGMLAAFLARRPLLFASALLLALSIKEDSFLLVAGFALTALLVHRRPAWAVPALAAGLAVFLFDQRFVLPHFSGSPAPWYSSYWSSFGATPLRAALGMAQHPLRFLSAIGKSGLRDLFEPLVFLPVAGPEWLLAAAPALLPYSAADLPLLSQFSLYYSTPVLPFLFAATASGLARLARLGEGGQSPETRRLRLRGAALLVMLVCALDGAGYRFERARPERDEVVPLLTAVSPGATVLIQGALLRRATGDSSRLLPLDRTTLISPPDAVLLDPAVDPYPRTRQELQDLVSKLSADPHRRLVTSAHGLLLFLPN